MNYFFLFKNLFFWNFTFQIFYHFFLLFKSASFLNVFHFFHFIPTSLLHSQSWSRYIHQIYKWLPFPPLLVKTLSSEKNEARKEKIPQIISSPSKLKLGSAQRMKFIKWKRNILKNISKRKWWRCVDSKITFFLHSATNWMSKSGKKASKNFHLKWEIAARN